MAERVRRFSDRPPQASAADPSDPDASDLRLRPWGVGGERDDAFCQIYQRFFRKIYRFFVRRGFTSEDCMDLAQETFVRVYTSLETFRGESRFEAWLFKIATNIYRNRLRAQATLKRAAQEVPFDDDAGEAGPTAAGAAPPAAGTGEQGPLREVLAEERAQLLHAAMEGLPAQMRRCVQLRVMGDYKYCEIAVLMQVSIETVKSHLFQARQQLKDRLGGYFTDLEA